MRCPPPALALAHLPPLPSVAPPTSVVVPNFHLQGLPPRKPRFMDGVMIPPGEEGKNDAEFQSLVQQVRCLQGWGWARSCGGGQHTGLMSRGQQKVSATRCLDAGGSRQLGNRGCYSTGGAGDTQRSAPPPSTYRCKTSRPACAAGCLHAAPLTGTTWCTCETRRSDSGSQSGSRMQRSGRR